MKMFQDESNADHLGTGPFVRVKIENGVMTSEIVDKDGKPVELKEASPFWENYTCQYKPPLKPEEK